MNDIFPETRALVDAEQPGYAAATARQRRRQPRQPDQRRVRPHARLRPRRARCLGAGRDRQSKKYGDRGDPDFNVHVVLQTAVCIHARRSSPGGWRIEWIDGRGQCAPESTGRDAGHFNVDDRSEPLCWRARPRPTRRCRQASSRGQSHRNRRIREDNSQAWFARPRRMM